MTCRAFAWSSNGALCSHPHIFDREHFSTSIAVTVSCRGFLNKTVTASSFSSLIAFVAYSFFVSNLFLVA